MNNTRSDSAERRVLTAIGVARIVWGLTTALGSAHVHRCGGIGYPGPDGGVWIKAFGVRDVILGAGALHSEEAVRRATLRAGIAMDLFDAGAVIVAARQGMPRRAARIGVLMAGGTAVFAAAGPGLLRMVENRRADRVRPMSSTT
ncbi:hypothetical protein BOX37_16390 [Nocardia mangyaensis]|uniref:DUF4267 domain-containing protein n=1 Tax=Nocardia mangyaensis TaxID=2213200 RepID=A0A1J0VTA0_9NOCA|nr:hypothetical protein BOX37_16390 [Nocardia mangyaensis]